MLIIITPIVLITVIDSEMRLRKKTKTIKKKNTKKQSKTKAMKC